MRKTIARSITATTIKSVKITFEGGAVITTENEPLTVSGKVNTEKALKIARKAYGDNAQVTEVTTVDDAYEISVDDFIKYAKKVAPQT